MAVALLAGSAGIAGAQDAAKPKEEVALGRLAAELPRLIKAADADGNGSLNAVEFRSFAPALKNAGNAVMGGIDPTIAEKKAAKDLKKYDKNADGKLDDDEKKAMQEEARLKEIKDFDWDRDGKLDEKEKSAMGWAAEGKLLYAFRKVDTDANGEASAAELGLAVSSLTGIKVKAPK